MVFFRYVEMSRGVLKYVVINFQLNISHIWLLIPMRSNISSSLTVFSRGVTIHSAHETRRDTILGSRERDEILRKLQNV